MRQATFDGKVKSQTEMATYVLFAVHTDDDDNNTNDDDVDDTLIFYIIDQVCGALCLQHLYSTLGLPVVVEYYLVVFDV